MKHKVVNWNLLIVLGLIGLAMIACSLTGMPRVNNTSQPTGTSMPPIESTSEQIPVETSMPLIGKPLISHPELTGFDMFDENNGWGVTETNLVRSVDGGESWYDITPPGVASMGYSASVYFLDPDNGWLVAPSADYQTGMIYATHDGGLIWTSSAVQFPGGSFNFIDQTNGFILVGRGAAAGSSAVDLFATADGGNSWQAVYVMQTGAGDEINTLPFMGQKSGLTFTDSLHGWVGGNIPMDGFVYLYKTVDGGGSWTKQDITLPAGYETAMTEVFAPRFFSSREGILPMRLLRGVAYMVFYVSHDGGENWSTTSPLQSMGQFSNPSMQEIIVWDGGAILQASHDGGFTWNQIPPNIEVKDILMKIDFIDANNGWLLTGDANNQHSLYKTNDGGVTWMTVIP